MTLAEAIEIVSGQNQVVLDRDIPIAAQVLAEAYLAEHDPTPLTIESVSEVLGKPGYEKSVGHYWPYKNSNFYMTRGDSTICLNYTRLVYTRTVGQLRRIASAIAGTP